MKKFLGRLIGFSLGPIIGAMISFLTVPIITYFILPAEFGKASMFTIVQSLVVTFIYLGIDQSYTREYHYVDDKKKLFQNSLFLPLALSLIMGILIFLLSDKFSLLLFDSTEYKYMGNLFSVMIIFSVIERFLLLSIRMQEKAFEFSIYNIFLKLIVFLSTLILIYLGYRSFLTIIFSAIFGQILGDLFLIIKYRKLFYFKQGILDLELLKKLFLFGAPLIIAASVNNLLNTSGRFFLRGYSTYHDLGIYTAAIKISNILQIVQQAFTSFWVPTAYRWNREKKDIKHFNLISNALLLILSIGFFVIIFFKQYIVMILSSDYSEAQYVAGLVALSPILYTLSETTTLGIVFSGKSYYNIWISILSLIPNLILNLILTPTLGTIGAAISTASAYMVFCFGRTYFSKKSGFGIDFSKQFIVTILFYITACINTMSGTQVFYATVILCMVTFLAQFSTIKTVIQIRKSNEDWDFN